MKNSVADSIRRYLARMNARIADYDSVPVDALTVCVSVGNNKVGKALNVSLPAIVSCTNCAGCMAECYDRRDCRYGNVMDARARNYSILSRDMEKYFRDVVDAILHHPSFTAFRWHVGGDVPPDARGVEYVAHMVAIAREFPQITFWTYTKNYYAYNEYVRRNGGNIADAIPDNLSVMFSQWRGIPMSNPYGFPEFRAYYDDETPAGGMQCPGDCRICRAQGIGCPHRMTVWTRIRGQVKEARKASRRRA